MLELFKWMVERPDNALVVWVTIVLVGMLCAWIASLAARWRLVFVNWEGNRTNTASTTGSPVATEREAMVQNTDMVEFVRRLRQAEEESRKADFEINQPPANA